MTNPAYIKTFWENSYSEIIDVRSEGEFAEDHIPGALNLPVLNNEERARVGTIYAQESHFEARKIGSAMIARNIARHLDTHLAGMGREYHPLIYCWRGGMRSSGMAQVLSQVGWRVTVLEGGYKTYRARVRGEIDSIPGRIRFIVLCGLTGSGKTLLLKKLSGRGCQVLDLEGLARHRGSLLGEFWDESPEAQPSQKWFESLLAQKIRGFDPSLPVWVESESNRIGGIHIPSPLWDGMRKGRSVEVEMPLHARVAHLLNEYPHFMEQREYFKTKLESLIPLCGRKNVERWRDLIDRGEWGAVAGDLLARHYDPSYRRSIKKTFGNPEKKFIIADINGPSADDVLEAMQAFSGSTPVGGV